MIDEPSTNDPPPTDASGTDFHLAPANPGTSDAVKAALSPGPFESKNAPTDPPAQFSLGEFLVWIAIVSIGLSGLVWILPQIFAGLCGFLALAMLIAILIWNPNAPLFQLVWYALLAMYMISIIIAILAPQRLGH